MSTLSEQADALMKGITPGEWVVIERPQTPGEEIERFIRFGPERKPGDWDEDSTLPRAEDTAFIAAAPQLVRDLLAALKDAEALAERLKVEKEEWRRVVVPTGGAFGPDFAKQVLEHTADFLDATVKRAEAAEAELVRLRSYGAHRAECRSFMCRECHLSRRSGQHEDDHYGARPHDFKPYTCSCGFDPPSLTVGQSGTPGDGEE